jgi:hypothetical protein
METEIQKFQIQWGKQNFELVIPKWASIADLKMKVNELTQVLSSRPVGDLLFFV